MATHYNIRIDPDNGETFTDQVDSGIKATVAQLAADPLFDLGEHVITTQSTDGDRTIKIHRYERGTIRVTTNRNQYTPAQRQGRRRF
jgi:hypothetical protein